MSETSFEVLATAAYKGERVAARRLATRTQITEAAALNQVLTLAAGTQGLAHLLATREQLRVRDEARRLARTEEKTQLVALRALRKASMQPGAGANEWRGWFDGSAHPNPGRIGIGALLCGPAGERIEISRRAGHGNSGEAEYLALAALLEAALHNGASGLVIYGDSQVVVNDVNLGAQAVAAGRGALGQVSLRWVPRHRNGDADRLSQQAIDRLTDED
jgi:ribonuclease HI